MLCTFLSALIACSDTQSGDDTQQKVSVLQDEVLDVHDAVMPKTELILELQQQISAKITQLESNSTNTNEENLTQLSDLKKELEEAEEGMMQWMRSYADSLDADMTPQHRLTYLQNEMKKIQEVQVSMEASIEQAQQYLNKK